MKETTGNIWNYYYRGHWIAITTNGVIKKDGTAVMGSGIAAQAAEALPDLPYRLGDHLRRRGNEVAVFDDIHLLTLPTKSHWYGKASLELIGHSLWQIVKWADQTKQTGPIYLPRPGCGLGQLGWEPTVRKLCEEWLDDRFVVLQYPY